MLFSKLRGSMFKILNVRGAKAKFKPEFPAKNLLSQNCLTLYTIDIYWLYFTKCCVRNEHRDKAQRKSLVKEYRRAEAEKWHQGLSIYYNNNCCARNTVTIVFAKDWRWYQTCLNAVCDRRFCGGKLKACTPDKTLGVFFLFSVLSTISKAYRRLSWPISTFPHRNDWASISKIFWALAVQGYKNTITQTERVRHNFMSRLQSNARV